MSLDLPPLFDPSMQTVSVMLGSSGKAIPIEKDVSVLNGTLVLSQIITPFLPITEAFV